MLGDSLSYSTHSLITIQFISRFTFKIHPEPINVFQLFLIQVKSTSHLYYYCGFSLFLPLEEFFIFIFSPIYSFLHKSDNLLKTLQKICIILRIKSKIRAKAFEDNKDLVPGFINNLICQHLFCSVYTSFLVPWKGQVPFSIRAFPYSLSSAQKTVIGFFWFACFLRRKFIFLLPWNIFSHRRMWLMCVTLTRSSTKAKMGDSPNHLPLKKRCKGMGFSLWLNHDSEVLVWLCLLHKAC